jgi:hypothetical protein
MLISIENFSKKHYAILGRLVLQKEPETARKLLSIYLPQEKPVEDDFSKIPDLFLKFCTANDIDREDYFSSASKSSKVSTDRLFIAVVLHLFNPAVYNQPTDQIILRYGLVRSIGLVLKQKESNVSTMIRQVILWEKQYEDFAGSVKEIIEKLTGL